MCVFAGGEALGPVRTHTARHTEQPDTHLTAQRERLYRQQARRLQAYADAQANFDAQLLQAPGADWHIDDYAQDLMLEGPGEPWPDGSFAAAQRVLAAYTFPPPDLITGIYAPGQPLKGRVMLLRGRFLFFTFWFGVRVNQVISETRPCPDGSHEAVWGYSYQTLKGHYEMGQIDFTLHKTLETGRVLLKIHAVSKTGRIANPLYRLGFHIFGRYLQRRFAYDSMKRIKAQTGEVMKGTLALPPVTQ